MKKQAKNVRPWKLGALGSLCVILCVVFACSEEPDQQTKEMVSQNNTIEPGMEGKVFTVVEDWPQFPGGMEALSKHLANDIAYPEEARAGGVEGRVFVEFVVEKDGSLSNVKTVKGIGAGCEIEAVRALQNAPSFKPGSQRGRAVRVRMVIPVTFKLNGGEGQSTQGEIIVNEARYVHTNLKVDANYANGEWSGTVYDEEGGELPGANIVVAGTTTGTVSDLDGNFKVKADASKDLHISFVGYESVKLAGK